MSSKEINGEINSICIASRKSALAMVQTNHVLGLLTNLYPKLSFQIGTCDSLGDDRLDVPLNELGISGVFTKSLEDELLAKRARLAVHSLKDMPTRLPDGLCLAVILKRENPQDAVVFHPKHVEKGITTLGDLPKGAIIGTSSLRREALVNQAYPNLEIQSIRGNIQTRLSKLQDADEYDAIIVAAAGFQRGGLGDHLHQFLPADSFGYGVGQGSIGIECCQDDQEILDLLKPLEDELSSQCCTAERSLLYHLEGGCQISMGVNTILHENTLTLYATLLSRDGSQCITDEESGSRHDAAAIGELLATRILQNSIARELLGPQGEKRALTYGSIERPGEAAAALSFQ